MQLSPGPPDLRRSIAQPAEHPALTRKVGGSMPPGPTKVRAPLAESGTRGGLRNRLIQVRILGGVPDRRAEKAAVCCGARSSRERAGGFYPPGWRFKSSRARQLLQVAAVAEAAADKLLVGGKRNAGLA